MSKLEQKFDGTYSYKRSENNNVVLVEGPSVIKELIEFLEDQDPLPPLEWQDDMLEASKQHVLDIGTSGM